MQTTANQPQARRFIPPILEAQFSDIPKRRQVQPDPSAERAKLEPHATRWHVKLEGDAGRPARPHKYDLHLDFQRPANREEAREAARKAVAPVRVACFVSVEPEESASPIGATILNDLGFSSPP